MLPLFNNTDAFQSVYFLHIFHFKMKRGIWIPYTVDYIFQYHSGKAHEPNVIRPEHSETHNTLPLGMNMNLSSDLYSNIIFSLE